MLFRIAIALLIAIMPIMTIAQTKSINVTVYNQDLGVIKEVRTIELPRGLSEFQFTDVAERIDPTSVNIKLDGIILEQNYQYDLVNMQKILSRYVDKPITLISEEDVITGTLLSAGNQLVLKSREGGLLMIPNLNDYRISVEDLPAGLITRPTLIWKVNSNKAGSQDAEISYQTAGMGWECEYVAVLKDKDSKLDINAWVSVDNRSGKTYQDAKLKLVAGDIQRAPKEYMRKSSLGGQSDYAAYSSVEFEQREMFEYHIYELSVPTTLADNETKQVSLFESANVNVKKKYVLPSHVDKIATMISFKNSKDNNMGRPLPAGRIRVMTEDKGSLELIGENRINHTPINEEIEIKLGDAFDIVSSTITKDTRQITRGVQEFDYETTIKNHKSEDITVEVIRSISHRDEILKSSHKYEKRDASTYVFQIPVSSGKETVLTFTVRQNRG